MSASNPENKHRVKADGYWRDKSIRKFGLSPIPENWMNDNLRQLSTSDNDTWKRYYKFRSQYKSYVDDDDDDDDYYYYHHAADQAKDIGYKEWCKHSFPTIRHLERGDDNKTRSSSFYVVIFSPYAIPHAMDMNHTYFKRFGWYVNESCANWEFRLLRFDFEEESMQDEEKEEKEEDHGKSKNYFELGKDWEKKQHGDHVQRELAKLFPDGFGYKDPLFQDGYECLCKTYIDGAPIDGIDCSPETWIGVEKIIVSNFNPPTVSRMKRWLFGSILSSEVLSDFDFLRLVFASCGSADFKILNGYIGYYWTPNANVISELIDMGIHDFDTLSWLEYQARWASGALRPQDMYYEYYNDLKEKAGWGRLVLMEQEKLKNVRNSRTEEGEESDDEELDDEQSDEDENDNEDNMGGLWEVPWLIWKRAEDRVQVMPPRSRMPTEEIQCPVS